jgi:hypothetical protein
MSLLPGINHYASLINKCPYSEPVKALRQKHSFVMEMLKNENYRQYARFLKKSWFTKVKVLVWNHSAVQQQIYCFFD